MNNIEKDSNYDTESLEHADSYDTISNSSKFALTTKDNPYDPFTQFAEWLMFDNLHGYCTCSYLARIANTSNYLSDQENDYEIERAINEIIKYDFMNLYKKVENKNYSLNENKN